MPDTSPDRRRDAAATGTRKRLVTSSTATSADAEADARPSIACPRRLIDSMPGDALALVELSGVTLVRQLGEERLAGITTAIMLGANPRDFTGAFTSARLRTIEDGLAVLLERLRVDADAADDGEQAARDVSPDQRSIAGTVASARWHSFHATVADQLADATSASERAVLRWLLGLNEKRALNLFGGNQARRDRYLRDFTPRFLATVEEREARRAALAGRPLTAAERDGVAWRTIAEIANEQATLAINGAEKSLWGKVLERTVLGAALHVLGLRIIDDRALTPVQRSGRHSQSAPIEPAAAGQRSFWLNAREDDREVDATVLECLADRRQQGVLIDATFNGVGNNEQATDKLDRFPRERLIGGVQTPLTTIVIAGRLPGASSMIHQRARDRGAFLLSFDDPGWVIALGRALEQALATFRSPLADLDHEALPGLLRSRVRKAPLTSYARRAIER